MAVYQYEPLPDPRECIRVLHLSAGSGDSPLKARMEIVRLQDKPEYEALSYCWGSNEKPCMLLLQDQTHDMPMPITVNLDLALRRMRDASHDRVLWTDAVCIDQASADKDDREKKHQVRIMHKIYASAAKVLVHLGERDDSLPQAAELLHMIHTAAITPSHNQQSAMEWIDERGLPSVDQSEAWEPLKAFFRRPWFRRKWTIQEAALASRLDFHCDTWKWDWDWMLLVIETIHNQGLGVLDYTTGTDRNKARQSEKGLSQINSLCRYRKGRLAGNEYAFQDLVYHFQTSEATDRRDHLFALLGMASDAENAELDPEYEQSTVLENCLRYAYYFLHRDQNLEVLYCAGLASYKMLAPSWIPNWYGGHQTSAFERSGGFWNPRSRPAHLNAARGTRLSVTSSSDSAVLGLKGVAIDTIQELANENLGAIQDTWRSKSHILTHRRQHLLASDRLTNQLQSYPTGQTPRDVQWRTMMCNTTRGRAIPGDDFREAYLAWRRVTTMTSAPGQIAADCSAAEPFDLIVGAWNSDKTFGLTTNGLVGMFPSYAKKYDMIVVLYGGEFPFVLRQCEKPGSAEYELVGQCYVHGVMEEGQLDLKKYQAEEREFLLGGSFATEAAESSH